MSEDLQVRAAFVRELGPPDRIEVGELTIAGPGANEVLVSVAEVCVNPVDTFVRSGRFKTPVPLPLVLGRDLVGEVAWAPKFSRFSVGDRVGACTLGHDGRQGSFATQAVVPEDRLYPILDDVAPRNVVAIAHPGTTAALAWFEHANLRAGQSVFVGGAAGNVGAAAVAMARWGSARVAASAGEQDLDSVRAAGAELAVDYRAPNLAQQVLDAVPEGFDVVWDTSGHMDYAAIAQLVRVGGKVLVTAAEPEAVSVPWAQLYTKDVAVLGFVHSRASADQMARAAQVVNRGLNEGWLRPNITEVTDLESARIVHERMEAGQVRGRIVLRV